MIKWRFTTDDHLLVTRIEAEGTHPDITTGHSLLDLFSGLPHAMKNRFFRWFSGHPQEPLEMKVKLCAEGVERDFNLRGQADAAGFIIDIASDSESTNDGEVIDPWLALTTTFDGGIILTYADGRIRDITQRAIQIIPIKNKHGVFMTKEGLLGKPLFDFLPPTAAPALAHSMRLFQTNKEMRFSRVFAENTKFIEWNAAPIFNKSKFAGSCLYVYDVTDNEQAKIQLEEERKRKLQTEKLASIGQLAAGIAHEINNPAAYVICNLATLEQYVTLMTDTIATLAPALENKRVHTVINDASQLIRETQEGAEKIKEIVESLRTFARSDGGDLIASDINELIETSLKIACNEIKHKCKVTKHLGKLPKIHCHPGAITQVFLNLIMNAIQAIPENGHIELTSQADNEAITVDVADNGVGIVPEHLSKIFDPFFTTNSVGKGTGLGLSIVYGIINKHGGKIDVNSQPGRGTIFSIHLPITPPPHSASDPESRAGLFS